jgi:4-carboxymuconolactone decarboxylase
MARATPALYNFVPFTVSRRGRQFGGTPTSQQKEESMASDLFERGMQIRREIFGPERADLEWERASEIERPLQELVTSYCFGQVWDRPGLSRKVRSMLTVAMLTALNRQGPLKVHVRGALNNGASKEEIAEIILHAAIYCGIPAAADATRVAMEAFREAGVA